MITRAVAWSLHRDPPRSGAYNMAKDEYLFSQALANGRPAMRLYRWEKPTLSVGRTQRVQGELRWEACRERGIGVVRRITGGRAVLHGDDLTYAVAAPRGSGLGDGLLATYRAISWAFLRFFEQLGFQATAQPYSGRQRLQMASPICFATPSAFEILINGKKVIGSAQRMTPGGFLQHGSIPLAPQQHLMGQLFRDFPIDRTDMGDLGTLGVWERLDETSLESRLVAAFAEALGVTMEPAPWSQADERAVQALRVNYPSLEPVVPPQPEPPRLSAAP